MRILFANKFFHLKGGAETVFFQEREFLLAQGHHIIDFSMMDDRNFFSPYSSFFVSNIDYHQNSGVVTKAKQAIKFIHSSEAVNKLEELICREKPELAHLHNIYHQLSPAIIPVLKKHGVKVVLTLHDYKLICPAYICLNKGKVCEVCQGRNFWKASMHNCQDSRAKSLLLTIEATWHKWRGSYDGVDVFLSSSRFMADLTARRISSEKIKVLRNGIDVNKYHPAFNDDGYALYFGRLSREKGVETLLRAAACISRELKLKIVGTGPLKNELQDSYPEAEFLGYQSGEKLKNLVARAAFVVVPSEWYENCSMVVLEAMALGKPVIGSRIGGIPEQIDEGKTGLLFEMGNVEELVEKMQVLASDSTLRTAMGRAARERLEKEYSFTQHCRQLTTFYEEVLDREGNICLDPAGDSISS